jgi:radical SAM protein with 4Fe4S-binding SPASM domain
MVMVPCSFDQQKRYEVQLTEKISIEDAWNSAPFERFRDKMRVACPNCEKRSLCMGGCPLMPEIVFCNSAYREIVSGENI